MSYLGMGIVFAAIVFLVVNAALSLATVLVWRAARGRIRGARALFVLRMAPSWCALAAVAGVAWPSYLAFEPHRSGERASVALIALLGAAAGIVALGLHRGAKGWLETRALERSWRRVAEATTVAGVKAYRIPAAPPFAALVGVVRPRVYVSDALMAVLSDEERSAVVAHEEGHRGALDNMKRALIRLAPDALAWTQAAREIERAWAAAVEEAADDHAAAGNGRLAVASALLKASRLAPVRLATVSSFCDGATIARRIERLLREPSPRAGGARITPWISVVALAVGAVLAGVSLLPPAYEATEAIVRSLQ